ncbi:hypothetical protein FRC08_006364 [Ceratobasidium sp. 394]|nr:hypothetical protein FRC08_006364 [Ceratobasidium sp. 394]
MDQSTEAPTRRASKRPATQSTRDSAQSCAHCRSEYPVNLLLRFHSFHPENKLRCSGERPQCSACASRDAPCEYDEATRAPLTRAAPTLTTSTSRKRPAPSSTYAQIKESRQRKRAAAAQTSCDFCRNDLRRKCDGLRPSCQSCIKRGEPCVYSGPASIPIAASSSTISLPRMPRSDDEESDIVMPSRSHSPDIPLAESASPTTPLDPNRPRYPQGNGLGHAGSTRNTDGTNCTRPVACFFCIKVELPCTGDFPTCVNCVRRNLQCTYPDPSSYAHQFPRQSAIHTRQLKDGTSHRSSASGAHTSPGRGQLTSSQSTLHPSRSHPGPLNQNHTQPGPTSPPMSASPDSMTHSRQRSMSGPNGLAGFGTEVIRSASAANVDTMPRSSGSKPTSIASPARPPNATHSRTPSAAVPPIASPGQPTLSNPIPLPAPRSTAQSPSTPIQSHSQPPTQTPTQTPAQTHGQLPDQNQPPIQTQNPTSAERVLDTVRGPPGDVRSPVNGVLVSPSGRTRDASLVHGPGTHSRSGSTSQGDGFVHEGPASYRARIGEGDGPSPNDTPLRNGVLTTPTAQSHPRVGGPTGTSARTPRVPMRPPDSDNEPAANTNDVQRSDSGPAPAEPRADPISGSGATRAPNSAGGTPSRHDESRPVGDSRTGASGPVQAPTPTYESWDRSSSYEWEC